MNTLELDARDELAIEQELDRRECAADPLTFMGRHVSIEEPNGRAIKLRLWPFQRRAVRALHDDKAIIVLKARRLGLSWIVLAYALWLAIFQQGVRILILCKTGDDAAELLDRIRRMRDRIAADKTAAHLLAGLETLGKDRDAVTTLDVGASTIKALVGTPSAARSETAGLIILDEFGFQRGAGEIWTAALPTIEGGGRVACVSTGNGAAQSGGIGAEFAKQWARAIANANEFVALFFPWSDRPDRDQAWYAAMESQLGDPERMRREYPSEPADAFVSPDAELVYDSTHLAAALRRGQELDDLPRGEKVGGPVWMGIDWGVNTHVIFARRLPGGGLYAFGEVVNKTADLEQTTADVVAYLQEHDLVVDEERFDAAEPILHKSFRRQFYAALGYSPRWLKIPFSKYKQLAIKYGQLLLRRSHEGADLRYAAISPTGCPELARQMSILEWADADLNKVDKHDDHGPDGWLTLLAELAEAHYATEQSATT